MHSVRPRIETHAGAEEAVSDRRIVAYGPLPTPDELREELPADGDQLAVCADGRADVTAALEGRDDRMVLIVGPCSVHDADVALEYGSRLAKLREEISDAVILVMRTYFEKPRTSIGWKGLIYDPHLDGTSDASEGLRRARSVLLDVTGLGLPCAVEVLDTITPQYQAELVSWAAIGARTVESQVHRQLASGLSMPVGFKNATDGTLAAAVNAVAAAVEPHAFFGVDPTGQTAIVRTTGNDAAHIVLRGGNSGPNFDAGHVRSAAEAARRLTGHERPVLIDASHGNSAKDHRRQRDVVAEALRQWSREPRPGVLGLMLESNLNAGRQDWSPSRKPEYGVSITDACIGWEETEELLHGCAEVIRAGR
jgi:3-deoxy-7-phosphoheptulonate synthase